MEILALKLKLNQPAQLDVSMGNHHESRIHESVQCRPGVLMTILLNKVMYTSVLFSRQL
jgi:hypothetical protein